MDYRIKTKENRTIDCFKAQLVAKRFKQFFGIDYEETFSPIIRPTIIRLMVALSLSLNWKIKQLDVKNAFLHDNLKETVYME